MKITNEQKLVKFLKSPTSTFKYNISGFNVGVFGFFSNKCIGNVDIVLNLYRTIYFIEVKLNPIVGMGDFWTSLKVLGYVAAENLNKPYAKVKPCIMIRKELITNDSMTILGALGIGYISVDLDEEIPKFEYFL